MNDIKTLQNFVIENTTGVEIIKYTNVTRLDESTLTKVSDTLAEKLYTIAIKKYKDLDFNTLENSKGDITKYSQYSTIKDTLNLLVSISGADTLNDQLHPITVAYSALANLEAYKVTFMNGFRNKTGILKIIFNLISKAIIEYTSLLISTCVEMVNTPGSSQYSMVYTKKEVKDRNMKVLYDSLNEFNRMCKSGQLEKLGNDLDKKENLLGAATLIGAGKVVSIIMASVVGGVLAVQLLRMMIYAFYSTKISIKKALEVQAALLEVNATMVDGKASDKQKKLAETLRKLADKLSIESRTAKVDVPESDIDLDTIAGNGDVI